MALNLVQHRSTPTVWDRVNRTASCDGERLLAAVAAGTLLVAGSRRRTPVGLLMAMGGACLAWWAASGGDERRRGREWLRARLSHRARTDKVVEASEESFPASDSPPWTTGGSGTEHGASQRSH